MVVCLLLDGLETVPENEEFPLLEEFASPKLYPRLPFELELLLITVPRFVRTPFTDCEPRPPDVEVTFPTVRRPVVFPEVPVPTVARRLLDAAEFPEDIALPP